MSSPAAGESAAAGYAKTLVDDVVREILLRLPSSTVVRSRAVCRTWNRLTTESSFLAAHAERQPAELLVVSGKQPSSPHLDTIPLSLQAAVEVVEGRRSHLHYPEHCEVRAMLCSCDGLLLFDKTVYSGCDYFLCNPVTRQGIRLDLMPPTCGGRSVRMCGFYRHGPSGEHRLLVLVNDGRTGPAAHYVFSLAAAASQQPPPRRLGPVADGVLHEICFNVLNPHVHHRGKLYSTMHPVARSADKIMSFDTVSEAFRLISRPPWPRDRYHCPPVSEDICLLELDGMLALTVTVTAADPTELWVLEDYENDQSWSHRFRIDVTPAFCASWATDTGVPDVILVGSYTNRFVALYHLTEKRIVKQIELVNDSTGTSGHFLFKDSLVQYDFLDPY